MCQFSFCYWILSDPESDYSWINVPINHSCLSESYLDQNWKFLKVWCWSLGIFSQWPNHAPSLLAPLHALHLWPAAVVTVLCQVLGWICAFHLWNERDAMAEGGVSWDQESAKFFNFSFALQQCCWCCSCLKVKLLLHYNTWRFWPSLLILFFRFCRILPAFPLPAQLPGDVRIT